MGLRLRLYWFEKKTELGVDHEYSSDFGDNNSLLERLGILAANNINNGDFDVETHWIPLIQPLFYHWINQEDYDYQLAFEYKTNWSSKDNIKKGHNMMTEQYISIDELVGIPFPYPIAEPPKGWFACHGQEFDKEKYPKLAKCYPDGKLPDLRGEFIRGVDSSRSVLSSQKATEIRTASLDYFGVDETTSDSTIGTAFSSADTANKFIPENPKSPNNENLKDPLADNVILATQTIARSMWNSGAVWISMRPRNIAFNYIVKAA